MNYRYFLAIFTLITVIVIAWILRPMPKPWERGPILFIESTPPPELQKPKFTQDELRDRFINSMDITPDGLLIWNGVTSSPTPTPLPKESVSYGTLVMPTPLELPENYYQAQGKVLDWRKHHGFWIP